MKLNTLNTIVDDIILQLRNSNISESEHLSRIQVEQWVHNYRALLIKQDIDKGRNINPMYIQNIPYLELHRSETVPGKFYFITDKQLPKLIDFHFKTGLVSVKDLFGNPIEIGNETKALYQKYRKYTKNDYVAYLKNGHVCLTGNPNILEAIQVDIIAENPADVCPCFDPNGPYPVPANMIPTIKDLIMTKEFNILRNTITDLKNDSQDQTQSKQN